MGLEHRALSARWVAGEIDRRNWSDSAWNSYANVSLLALSDSSSG